MTRLSFIPAQFVKVTTATRPDLAQYVVAGIYIKEGAPGVARAWKVNADGSDGGEITFTNEGGKDDTVSAAILPDGGVRLVVSEATPGGSGTTAQPTVYHIPGVFPPQPPAIVGEGGYSAPANPIRIVNAASGWSGNETILLAPFGIPACAALNVRVCANAAVVGARGRAGPDPDNTAGAVTVVVQHGGTRNYGNGAVAPGVGHTLVVMADNGALSELYVDVLGWWS